MTFESHTDAVALCDLQEMLTYCRPDRSKSERKFIRKYILPLGVEADPAGNLFKRIGTAPVAWSCHTDTVHCSDGTQAVRLLGGRIDLPLMTTSACLGADDTAGVWLMREMILSRVPGLYLFHRGEEVGGRGSKHIANGGHNLLSGIECAIALDRKGKADIITHQMFGRCCSDEFAFSLDDALGGGFVPNDGGTFTDTANYTDLIGECTNVSVGYQFQHSMAESQDVQFLFDLREKLRSFDSSKLVFKRKPGEFDDDDWFDWVSYGGGALVEHGNSTLTLEDVVRDHPAAIAAWMEELGWDVDGLLNKLEDYGGYAARRFR